MTQDTLLNLTALILILPIFGFTFLIFFGKRLGRVSGWIGTTILGIDLLLSIAVAYSKIVTFESVNLIQLKFTWFEVAQNGAFRIGYGVDNLAAMMLIVVTLISFLVHLFSTEYMREDKLFSRYFAYLGLFSFSMLGIVIANNFLCMYIFWELVGISSYLLIGFWFEKDSAANAGKKAFIVNRIGDLGFFVGILIVFTTYGTFFYDDVFSAIGLGKMPFDNGTMLTVAGILIFCGAIGKSAQFPLHVWLPDAMEGPTPVSALIHAATMVAAGVYLVARVFPMLSADALTFIAFIGAITAFIAASIAITQNDFKKVLAYSTVSALGYMVMGLGVGSYTNGFFLLVTHAWFKAALFLASGSVIHAMHHAMHNMHDHHTNPQDINNMGGLRKTMPWTYYTFMFATIAISGVPLTSGFLSKDGVLAGTLAYGYLTGNWIIPIMGFGTAGLTAFYMFRLMIIAFHGEHKTEVAKTTHENKFPIVFPLVLLAVMSFWFFYTPNPIDADQGWFTKSFAQPETVVPKGLQFDFLISNKKLEEAKAINNVQATETHEGIQSTEPAHPEHSEAVETGHGEKHSYFNKFAEEIHHQHYPAMIYSLLIAGCGILFSFLMYQFKIFSADNFARQLSRFHRFSYRKWYFDEVYQATAVNGTVGIAKLAALFDLYVIDGLVNLSAGIGRWSGYLTGFFDNIVVDGIVNLTANATGFFGVVIRKVQTGSVQTYIIFAILGILILAYFVR